MEYWEGEDGMMRPHYSDGLEGPVKAGGRPRRAKGGKAVSGSTFTGQDPAVLLWAMPMNGAEPSGRRTTYGA